MPSKRPPVSDLSITATGTNGYDLHAVEGKGEVTVRARKGTKNHCVVKLPPKEAIIFGQHLIAMGEAELYEVTDKEGTTCG